MPRAGVTFDVRPFRPNLENHVSTTDDASVTWLTQDAYDRLSRELDELIANRPRMAKEINDRREEGDLRENGGYHAAREEQGKQEGRILQLQALLREAKVGEVPLSDGVAGPGMVVQVRFDGDDEVETFLIGSREETETAGIDVYSAASPLGKALTGAREGDTVSYDTPTGKTMKVTLVSAHPFTG
jgi:transcription elongation factor GreA